MMLEGGRGGIKTKNLGPQDFNDYLAVVRWPPAPSPMIPGHDRFTAAQLMPPQRRHGAS